MKKLVSLISLLVIMVSSATSASLSPQETLNLAKSYKVYWSGFHVADLKAGISDNKIDAIIESYGLVKEISKYSSKTFSVFKREGDEYIPTNFYTEFQQRKRSRTIDIRYDHEGGIKEEEVVPPDNRAKRPAVPDELKEGAVDPLTAVMIARQKIKEGLALATQEFSIQMYDGRRLSKLDFQIHGKMVEEISRREQSVIHVSFKRYPVAGYTNNELKRFKKEEPVITLYLSDDAMLLPIKADADAPLGSATIVYEKDCPSVEQCG